MKKSIKNVRRAKKAWVTINKNLGFSHDTLVPDIRGIKTYEESEKKKEIRTEVVEACKALPKNDLPIVSLTSHECLQELAIIEALPDTQFHAVEADFDTFRYLMLKKIKHNWAFLVSLVYAPISNIIYTSRANSYRAMLLDYCETIKVYGNEIAHAITNDLVVKNGFIYITLCQRAGGNDTQKQVFDLVRKYGKGRYKIVYDKGYRDGAPMYSAIIKRIK